MFLLSRVQGIVQGNVRYLKGLEMGISYNNKACLQKPHKQTMVKIPGRVSPHTHIKAARVSETSERYESAQSLANFVRREEAEIEAKFKAI